MRDYICGGLVLLSTDCNAMADSGCGADLYNFVCISKTSKQSMGILIIAELRPHLFHDWISIEAIIRRMLIRAFMEFVFHRPTSPLNLLPNLSSFAPANPLRLLG